MDRGSWRPVDVRSAATAIAAALDAEDTSRAFRCVVQLLDDLGRVPPRDRAGLVEHEPPSTGDVRWDALLAGAVEHGCYRHGLAVPAWTVDPGRFLERWWFVSTVPGLRASAFAEAPAALANRGVFLHAASLESV